MHHTTHRLCRFSFSHFRIKMKDVAKYDLQQPLSIEFERQRHLAQWLMQSSPHMPKPAAISVDKSSSSSSKKKNATAPIVFCLNRISSNTNSFSNSHSNLPLQIVTGRDGHKAKIRRFNSHDTSANMFSVADFENARLARRNEMENALLSKQKNRYKMNSLSSGGDYSTGDSKGSKFSNEVRGTSLKSRAPNIIFAIFWKNGSIL